MSQWYVVSCIAKREARVIANLAEQGIAAFAPCEIVLRRLGRDYEPVSQSP